MRIAFAVISALSLMGFSGCGSSNAPEGGVGARFEISPKSAVLQANQTQQFQAVIIEIGANDLTWSIDEGAAGGSITPQPGSPFASMYQAPSTSGIYHVRLTINSGLPQEMTTVAPVLVKP